MRKLTVQPRADTRLTFPQETLHQTHTAHAYKQILRLETRTDAKAHVAKERCHLKMFWWMKNDTQRKVSNLHGFGDEFLKKLKRRWKVWGQALFQRHIFRFTKSQRLSKYNLEMDFQLDLFTSVRCRKNAFLYTEYK